MKELYSLPSFFFSFKATRICSSNWGVTTCLRKAGSSGWTVHRSPPGTLANGTTESEFSTAWKTHAVTPTTTATETATPAIDTFARCL